jgi:hypothetical protein
VTLNSSCDKNNSVVLIYRLLMLMTMRFVEALINLNIIESLIELSSNANESPYNAL